MAKEFSSFGYLATFSVSVIFGVVVVESVVFVGADCEPNSSKNLFLVNPEGFFFLVISWVFWKLLTALKSCTTTELNR